MPNILAIYGLRDDRYVRVAQNSDKGMAFEFEVNVDLLNLIPKVENIRVTNLFLPLIVRSPEESIGLKINFNAIDLIFNAICDPGMCKKAVESAIEILRDNPGIPVINSPEKLYKVQRDEIYRLMRDVDELYVPKTIRIKPESLQSIVEAAKTEKLFPFIFREAGRHTNIGMEIVRNELDIQKLEKYPFMGQEYYLTRFVDYRSEDGLYRKYRVIVIDGRIYPRHLIISDVWNVHAEERARLMDKDERLREEEKKWLETFSEDKVIPIKEIQKRLDLEYFAVDFAYLSDGKILLFEASPCFRYTITGKTKPKYNYHTEYIRAIENAILNMLVRKAIKRV